MNFGFISTRKCKCDLSRTVSSLIIRRESVCAACHGLCRDDYIYAMFLICVCVCVCFEVSDGLWRSREIPMRWLRWSFNWGLSVRKSKVLSVCWKWRSFASLQFGSLFVGCVGIEEVWNIAAVCFRGINQLSLTFFCVLSFLLKKKYLRISRRRKCKKK